MYNNIFSSLLKRIYKVQKLPIKRYSWEIEMKVLELNCEIDEFIARVLKKRSDNQILKQLKDHKDISKNLR